MKDRDLIALDGKLELYARDGRFLGLLSSRRNDPNSIVNPHTYGNPNYINSIHYQHGIYGGEYGRHSPYNRYCLCPPALVFQQQYLGIVTKNTHVLTNGLVIIDPDLIVSIYTNLSSRFADLDTKRLAAVA
ncbi:MAG: hypothetical protein HC778_07480 [Chamaesiphon sp. CSU_1_12]|nr:hypothetical protein [Chamaesiphon sp. CSU_1_12]